MLYNKLGRTGLEVSSVSLGTVSLGVPYGIQFSGEFGTPAPEQAERLLHEAADAGINLFDTAPSYGDSERILGNAFSNRADLYIATKVALPSNQTARERKAAVISSLQSSLRTMRRDVLDIVQIHNARAVDIIEGEVTEVLLKAREQGLIRFLGASVYGEEAAAEVIQDDNFDILQLAYSILDQRPARSTFANASRAQTAILARSALLKGVLSKKAKGLPQQLRELKEAAENVRRSIDCSWGDLPEVALRFCLSNQQVSSVLIGARTIGELRQGLSAWQAGPLAEDQLELTTALALKNSKLVNPTHWPVP